jgi:hypothetical protein
MSAERIEQIKNVLSQSAEPMSCDEIAAMLDFILPFGPIPYNSLRVVIEQALATGDSEILKTHPGVYLMRANAGPIELREAQMLRAEGHLDRPGIFTCYGEEWHRNLVEWKFPLELIGSQMMSSTKINFATQIGFYTLGWGIGEPVEFIGFSGERAIGECLFEHTMDRLSGRWKSFSFYGLRPIMPDGSFGPLPESVTLAQAVVSMLSVLVDVGMPRANHRYHDHFSSLEFAQRES